MTYMPASTGGVIMPPVPPRSFPPGTVSFYFTVMLVVDFRKSVWLLLIVYNDMDFVGFLFFLFLFLTFMP